MSNLETRGFPEKIRSIMRAKRVSQTDLGKLLGVSGATISRWLGGKNEPTPQAYVALGNLAGSPDDVYFWERAGVHIHDHDASSLKRDMQPIQSGIGDFKGPAGQRTSYVADEERSVVAIPLFNVCAYADEVPPQEHISFARADVEEFLMAPSSWCPNPKDVICMHVCGESMFPTIQNNALLFVDRAANNREELNRELVVVSHRDLGLKVARLQRLAGCFCLILANSSCMPIDITDASRWRIVGKVLWWVSKDDASSETTFTV